MNRHYSARGVLMTSTRRNYSLPTLLLCVLALTITDRAYAETNMVEFNIPVQSVPAALNEFARQARVQLFFITDGFEHVRANAVIGTFPRQEALQRLLTGTGLKANYTADALIKVAPGADSTSSVIHPSNTVALLSADISSDRTNYQVIDESPDVPASQGAAPVTYDEQNDRVADEILVTGSRIRGVQNAAPVITITAEDIDKAGFSTTEQLVRSLPQNFGGGASQQNNSFATVRLADLEIGTLSGSEVSIDLRGLGSDSTLTLLNGRRMSAGGLMGGFTDVSSIPVTAIERVEILTDGASAIYGADAIAGVVNFILRDDYEGAETRLRYGSDGGDGFNDIRFGQLFGKSWGSNNILLSYEYYQQDKLENSARAITATSDLRSLGGDNWSFVGGNPATIRANGTTYAVPSGQNGAPGSLSATDFVAGTQNFLNAATRSLLLPEQDRHSALLQFRRDNISKSAEYYLDALYSKRETTVLGGAGTRSFNVPDTNPYFVDPSGTGLTSVRVQSYSFTKDLGLGPNDSTTETFNGATGVRFNLSEAWQGEISVNYAEEETERQRTGLVSTSALNAALAGTTVETAFNPFADGSNTNQALLDSMRETDGPLQAGTHDALSVGVGFSGSLLEMSSGTANLAAGMEYREESMVNLFTTRGASGFHEPVRFLVNDDRRIFSAYAELFLPLVGSKNARSGLRRLELSVAARYDDYDDFGNTTNPKIGIVWSPTQSLTVRGTIGTSFKPPLLFELNPGAISYFNFLAAPFLAKFGGNPDLQPEEATTWTAGIQISPESLPGFNMDLTYFDVDFKNRIKVAQPSILDVLEPEYAAFTTVMPTQEEIDELVFGPLWDFCCDATAEEIADGTAPVDVIVDNRVQNVAATAVSGFDLQLGYSFDSTAGQFDLGLNASYLLEFEDTLLPGFAPVDRLDKVTNPVSLRLRSSLAWSRGGWGASAFVNYVDSYVNDQPHTGGGERVDSWTTVDLQLSYDTENQFSNSLLNDIRLSLSIRNLFDEDPPFVNSNRRLAYDPINANPLGRLFALEINKTWGGR